MLGVSAGNYLLNLATARWLEPAEFGDANLAINLVLASAAIAATLQLVTARSVASGHGDTRSFTAWAWAIGIALGAVLTAGAWSLQNVLSTSTPWMFVIVGVGLPVYFVQAVSRGKLQGELRLGRLAASYGAEAALRIVVALGLLSAGAGVVGVAIAISVSFVGSAVVARSGTPRVDLDAGSPEHLRSVTATATALLVGQVVIANGDVVLAKWLLAPDDAGAYAAAALIGRALFFLSWPVVHAAFPIVAKATCAAERRAATRRALIPVIAGCSLGVASLAAFGDGLAPVLLGDSAGGAIDLLVLYATATSLFAVANVLASVGLASARRGAPSMLAAGALLQTALLVAAGDEPIDLVRAQAVAMLLTLIAVVIAHALGERSPRRCSAPVQTASIERAVQS